MCLFQHDFYLFLIFWGVFRLVQNSKFLIYPCLVGVPLLLCFCAFVLSTTFSSFDFLDKLLHVFFRCLLRIFQCLRQAFNLFFGHRTLSLELFKFGDPIHNLLQTFAIFLAHFHRGLLDVSQKFFEAIKICGRFRSIVQSLNLRISPFFVLFVARHKIWLHFFPRTRSQSLHAVLYVFHRSLLSIFKLKRELLYVILGGFSFLAIFLAHFE